MSQLAPVVRPRGFVLGKAYARRVGTAWAICLVALAAAVVEGPRPMSCCGKSKVDIAVLTVKKYAFEAYPKWVMDHPARTCPASLAELNPWMNNTDIRDPYGADYQWSCGTYAGRTELNVWSLGEDQILGSSDDIRSSQ